VVAAAVGGLRTAVRHERSGLLVDGHDPRDYADALRRILDEPRLAARLADGAVEHAAGFGWAATARGALASYGAAMTAPLARGRGRVAGVDGWARLA
jgi:D-inositol-3-phosphate glycosyltransferase